MDVKTEDEVGEVSKTEKWDNEEGSLGSTSKLKGSGSLSDKDMLVNSPGSFSRKDMFFRADKIDLKSLDVQLEKHLSRVWSRNIEAQRPTEEWEIDPSKLDIRYLVARGTYGTVYRGTYDNQMLQNFRPEIPRCCPSSLANVMKKCWDANPEKRPEMNEVVRLLEAIDTSKGGGMIPEGQGGGCLCFPPALGP